MQVRCRNLQVHRPAASHRPLPRHRRSQAGCGPRARHSFRRRSFRGVPASFLFLVAEVVEAEVVVVEVVAHLERISRPMEKEAMPVRLPVQGSRTEKAGEGGWRWRAHLRASAGCAP